jgi:hypothetical protein
VPRVLSDSYRVPENKVHTYIQLGVARETITICQFPYFNILTNHSRDIIYDDEDDNTMKANEDYKFFKDICSINSNILKTMTQEMKILVDSIDPTKARNKDTSNVNYNRPTHIKRKRRQTSSTSSLSSYDSAEQLRLIQETESISSGGSTSYVSNKLSQSDSQSTYKKHKRMLVHRHHRAAGAIAATILGTIAISPLIALLNVAVVDSVYGEDDQPRIGEIQLGDFKMGEQSLSEEINSLKSIANQNFNRKDANKLHRDLIHAELSLIHVFNSIYNGMKIASNNFLALITQANIGTATPAWLSKEELRQLKANFATHNYTLIETDYKKITMSLHRRTNNYIIKYGLPVRENEKKVKIFNIIPIPVYKNNKTYTPIIETPFVAISYTGRHYTPLSLQEVNKCLETPTC